MQAIAEVQVMPCGAVAMLCRQSEGGDLAGRRQIAYLDVARIENFVPYHDGLATLLTTGRVRDLLAECCGEPVLLFKDKINFKYPGGAAFTQTTTYRQPDGKVESATLHFDKR